MNCTSVHNRLSHTCPKCSATGEWLLNWHSVDELELHYPELKSPPQTGLILAVCRCGYREWMFTADHETANAQY